MITPPEANNSGRSGCGARPNRNKGPKLDIDQKRQLAIEWFTEPSNSNIGKFCVEIKQVPRARPFLRKAATELDLFGLRELRKDNEGIDEIAIARIKSFRPKWNKDGAGGGNVISPDPKTLGAAAMKKLLVDFFDDEHMTPLPRYLRRNNALDQKDAVLRIIKKVQLRKLRQDRDNLGVREACFAKIDQAMAEQGNNEEAPPPLESCETGLKRLQIDTHTRGRVKALETSCKNPEIMKPLLVEWFDDVERPSIAEFLEKKDAVKMRKNMRILVRSAQLQRLRKNCNTPNAREEAMEVIDSLFENKGNAIVKRRRINQKTALKKKNNSTMKDLLVEWFDDADMISVRHLLQQKGENEMRAEMVGLVTANGLRKLRKNRETSGVREEAMKNIDALLSKKAVLKAPEVPKIKKDRVILGEPVQQTVVVEKEYLESLVTEWFEDDHMRAVPKFLRDREEANLSASILRLVNKNGLRKLRKSRDDPETRELAMTRITNLFAEDKGVQKNSDLRRLHNRPSVMVRGQKVTKLEQEILKVYLVEWFYDENLISIADYLEKKGKPELRPVMATLIKKLGLRKLRKERHILRQTVTRKIDNAFKKSPAKASKAAPSAPPIKEMDKDETEYVTVATSFAQEGSSEDEGNFVVIK